MLLPSKYYHIYNRANGSENLFVEERNFGFFLDKWKQYINPIANSYAWCLMPNHFHFLIRIKNIEELQCLLKQKTSPDLESFNGRFISQSFSNLFNSYTKSFNKVYNRKGSLFIPNFKRKEIDNENYLKQIIFYIHNNPVHHGFTKQALDWKYSSIHNFIKNETDLIKNSFQFFKDRSEYLNKHEEYSTNKSLLDSYKLK